MCVCVCVCACACAYACACVSDYASLVIHTETIEIDLPIFSLNFMSYELKYNDVIGNVVHLDLDLLF